LTSGSVANVWAQTFATLPDVKSAVHRITVDGQTHEVSAAVVLVANCGEMIPPFFRLGPQVTPDDGWLDVVAVRADGVVDSALALLDVLRLRSKTGGSERIFTARGRVITIEVDAPARPVQLDGEAAGATPFEARLLPGALVVLTDRGKPHV